MIYFVDDYEHACQVGGNNKTWCYIDSDDDISHVEYSSKVLYLINKNTCREKLKNQGFYFDE